jgi:hypothetical protein
LLLAGACNAAPQAEPTQPVLPTAQAPSQKEIDDAYQRWQSSGNNSYLAEVEERRQDGHQKYLVVVRDGQVRAAQVLERDDQGDWGIAEALSLEAAQDLTVDGIFKRLKRDAAGEGSGPVNIKVSYDRSLGYPIAIHAEALAGLDPEGKVILDRRNNYDLTLSVQALLEDQFGVGKEPVFSLEQSGGPEAWCGLLRIFSDNTAVYTDDCREDVLQSEVPPQLQARLGDLRAAFASLDSLREEAGQMERLIVSGSGDGSADGGEVEVAWELAAELNGLLSEPIGLGLIVSYLQEGRLYGLDVYNRRIIPADLVAEKPVAGGAWTPDGKKLAFSRDGGLTLYDNTTGEFSELLASPQEGYYLPRGWSSSGSLLVDQRGAGGEPIRHGWIDVGKKSWQDLPAPEGIEEYGCDTGLSWAPDARRVAVTGLEYGSPCNMSAGLTVIDLETGAAQRIVAPSILGGDENGSAIIAGAQTPAWSPDGEWIAFALDQDASAPLAFPARLYRVHPDGSALTPLTSNSSGRTSHPVWTQDGSLYYSLNGAGAEADGIYHYLPGENKHTLLLQGTGLYPLSLSPDGEFLLYEDMGNLKLWEFRLEDVVFEIPVQGEARPDFIGWAQTGQ